MSHMGTNPHGTVEIKSHNRKFWKVLDDVTYSKVDTVGRPRQKGLSIIDHYQVKSTYTQYPTVT